MHTIKKQKLHKLKATTFEKQLWQTKDQQHQNNPLKQQYHLSLQCSKHEHLPHSKNQSLITPIIKVSDAYNTTSKMAVTCNRQDRFNDALDKLLSRMHKLTAKVDKIDKEYTQYKPQIHQRKKRGQTRQNGYNLLPYKPVHIQKAL